VFLGYQQWSLRATLLRLAQENVSLQQIIDRNVTRIAELEQVEPVLPAVPAVDEAALDTLRAELNARIQRLNTLMTELQERTGIETPADDGQWRLAEAEHLLRLANQQLQLGEDVATTITLLQLADQLLIDSDDTRVVEARQILLRELGELRAVENVDLEGLYLRLRNLRDQVADIEIAGSAQDEYRRRLTEQAGAASEVTASEDSSLIDTGLTFLGSVFVWRRWDDRPEIMNPPQELLAIKQNINLMLEQAQVALMMRQPMIYQESLQRARDWIDNYLSGLSETAPQLLAEVDSLLATRLSPALPDISGSLREIRQIRGAGADAVAGNLR
jgi:uroporphyrin-3 C-methyltransferase